MSSEVSSYMMYSLPFIIIVTSTTHKVGPHIYKKNIDNNLKRVCLLEFKANDTYVQHYQKDFVKLHNPKENEKDEETLRYFIEIFQKPKPCGKFKDFIKMVKENQENHYPMNNKIYSILKPVHVRCICFNNHNFEEYKDIQKEIS